MIFKIYFKENKILFYNQMHAQKCEKEIIIRNALNKFKKFLLL